MGGMFDDLHPEPGLLESLAGKKVVQTGTDDGREPVHAQLRRAAAMLGVQLGAKVVLVDRTRETWAESPHREGPFDVAAVEGLGRPYLAEQMRELLDLGVPDVAAMTISLPMLEQFADIAGEMNTEVAVVPERLLRPTVSDRLVRHDIAGQAAARAIPAGIAVVVVHADGRLSLL